MTTITELVHRRHIRGSVDAWNLLEKARIALIQAGKSTYVDGDLIVSLIEDVATEQDRLITLRPHQDPGLRSVK